MNYHVLLAKLSPSGKPSIRDAVATYLPTYLALFAINTKLRIAHFLAQAAHECANFQTLHEYASGAAYEGRKDLGNTQAGDGRRYKGRGIFQLTGRANYRRYTTLLRKIAKFTGVDLEAKPEQAADPEVSVATACLYWHDRKLNAYADKDDVRGVTKRINGGYNGLAHREALLVKAKGLLAGRSDDEVRKELEAEQKQAEQKRDGAAVGSGSSGTAGGGTATTQAPDAFAFDWHTLLYIGFGVALASLAVFLAYKAYKHHQRAQAFKAVNS